MGEIENLPKSNLETNRATNGELGKGQRRVGEEGEVDEDEVIYDLGGRSQ